MPGDAAQLVNIACSELPVDDADDQEQGRLEHRVRNDEGQAGERRIAPAESHNDRDEAELTDSAVCQHALQVVLPQGLHAAEQHGEDSEADEDRARRIRLGEGRGESREQIDARLDHRGRVQIRTHGGRRSHRAGEPEVEREDCGLAERTDEQAHDRRIDERAAGRIGEDRSDARRVSGNGEDDRAHEHHEAAERRGEEGLQRRSTRRRTRVSVTDQEVRQDARDLPEHHEHDDVVGEHEAVHRPGECHQNTGEATDAFFRSAEVVPAIDHHEGTDARNDQRHHPSERVHAHRDIDAEAFDPGICLERNLSVSHGTAEQSRVRERCERHQRGGIKDTRTHHAGKRNKNNTRDPEYGEDHEHAHLLVVAPSGGGCVFLCQS